jgi:hypothetical protein
MKFSLAYKLSWKDIISVVVMSLVLGLLFLFRGVDYHPGVSDECKSCIKDIGTMPRGGHYEEMLWNGVRHVHHSSNPNLSQFTKSNGLLAVNNHQTTKNCIDCHNDSVTAQAPSLGDLWVKFPRLDKETGRIIDFEKAVQYEFVKRYGGTKPFYNDVRITEIMVYAYEKAREKKLVFDVEPDDGKPISDDQLAALGTTFTCLGVFKKYGNPKGDIAPYIVKGCNIFTLVMAFGKSPTIAHPATCMVAAKNMRPMLVMAWLTILACILTTTWSTPIACVSLDAMRIPLMNCFTAPTPNTTSS